jgi:uncharacterized protein (TIGR02679 family)
MNSKVLVFKEEPGFLKLFGLFREKYQSIGRIGGNVSLKNFSDDEIEALAGFLGQPAGQLMEKGSISLLQFEKELTKTGFVDYTLLGLLEEVFAEPVVTKKEQAERSLLEENSFIESLYAAIPKAEWWLDWVKQKSPDTRWIWSLYKQDRKQLEEMMKTVFLAFLSLPIEGNFERLPFFAQRITGNPHYFDISETGGRLLLHCISVHRSVKMEANFLFPKGTEEINDLMAEYGLLRDDLWNFVTVQGLKASNQAGTHPVWEAAVHTNTVMNVPMKELAKLDHIWPATGSRVWIVENSSVASTIMDAVPDAAIICTHGQLRAASWRLLDRLAASECTMYYSGDIDPEGVLIADRLKKRYLNHLVLWRMDTAAYEESLSNEDIADRLVKLDQISSPEWERLILLMRKRKVAGYQEALVHTLIRDIKHFMQ